MRLVFKIKAIDGVTSDSRGNLIKVSDEIYSALCLPLAFSVLDSLPV